MKLLMILIFRLYVVVYYYEFSEGIFSLVLNYSLE